MTKGSTIIGDGTFQPKQDYAAGYGSLGIISGDFNGDDKIDLIITPSFDQNIALYVGNGDGTFQSAQYYGRTGGYPRALATADLNGDGKLDLITANYWDGGYISVFLNISLRLTAYAGTDQSVECTGHSGATVTLDGSGSYDPEGNALTYTWTWAGGSAEGIHPTITVPLGTTVVTLTVNNGKHIATDTVSIKVIDTTPPLVSIYTTPSYIWPTNGSMVDVAVGGEASDSCSVPSVVFTVTDEYGLVQPQISGFNTNISLEARRDGNDTDGRHYTITAVATDTSGNKSTASAVVLVPHDQR